MESVGKSSTMRELVIAVGGNLAPTENRKAWLARVADAAGLSIRLVRAAWHQERLSRKTEAKLKEAAQRHETIDYAARLESLAEQLGTKDQEFYGAQISQLWALARQFRGENNSSEGE